MANFLDTFNRADYPYIGNFWHGRDARTSADVSNWKIASNKAQRKSLTDLYSILGRYNPIPVGASYSVIWTIANAVGDNNAEMVFRWNATGGAGNPRLSIVITGTNGQLINRVWNSSTSSYTQVLVASWTRTATNVSTITLDDTTTHVTIYDSASSTPLTPVVDMGSTTYNTATGIGVISGTYDQFQIIDHSAVVNADFMAGRAEARISVDAVFELENPAGPGTDTASQHHAALSVSPYAVLDGIPVDASVLTASVAMALGATTVSDTGVLADPASLNLGSTVRWLASAATVTATQWNPTVGAGLYFTKGTDPSQKSGLVYSSPQGPQAHDALVFEGVAPIYLAGYSGSPAKTSYSLAFALVPRNSTEAYYELVSTDQSGGALGSPLQIIYEKGRLYVFIGHRVVTYETHKTANSPLIVVLSVDNTGQIARWAVQDLFRTYRTFSLKNVDTSNRFRIGNSDASASAGRHAQMDLFEVNYWNRALTGAEMNRIISLLAHSYGVVK